MPELHQACAQQLLSAIGRRDRAAYENKQSAKKFDPTGAPFTGESSRRAQFGGAPLPLARRVYRGSRTRGFAQAHWHQPIRERPNLRLWHCPAIGESDIVVCDRCGGRFFSRHKRNLRLVAYTSGSALAIGQRFRYDQGTGDCKFVNLLSPTPVTVSPVFTIHPAYLFENKRNRPPLSIPTFVLSWSAL